MSSPLKLANNAIGRLAYGLSSSATSMTLEAGDGALFPALGDGEWFPATLVRADEVLEVVKVTARVGDALTIVRAQEGTAAATFSAGDRVELRLTAGSFADEIARVENFAQAGVGAVPRTVQDKLRDEVSVKDYDSGSGDFCTMLQTAINKVSDLGGGTVVVPAGKYSALSAVEMKSGVTVRCEAGAVITVAAGIADDIIKFTGSAGSEFAFSASRTRGDTTIALSGSPDFAAGDIVHLVSYTSVFAPGEYNLGYHPTDNCYFSEWNIIAEDLGGGVYRLAIPFEFPGWTTAAKAKKVTPCADAHWIGGTVVRAAGSPAIFSGTFAYQCSVQDVQTVCANRKGISVEWIASWRCEGRRITNANDPTIRFNYSLDHGDYNRFKTVGSQDCGFVGIKESFGGQTVDFTYSSTYAPYANVRSYCRDGTFDRCFEALTSHPGCYREEWIDNRIIDCYDDGIVVRGYLPVIKKNIITSTVGITNSLTFSAGSFVIGRQYDIASVGTTDFTLVGAANNSPGTRFWATGVGTGTGTANQVDTYGIRLSYGGPRRSDISGNIIRGFYGAFMIYGSATLGRWANVHANIHENEIANCFIGLTASGIGNTSDNRYINYAGNHHSLMGRMIVSLPEYTAGCTVRNNVLDGDFLYDGGGSYVAYVYTAANCPNLTVRDNLWMRTKGGNPGKTKYFVLNSSISDPATFPAADWASQSYFSNNYASWATDASFVHVSSAKGSGYYQYGTLVPADYSSTIASGVAQAIPTPHRVFYVRLDTEGAAASDDLDKLDPHTNCWFQAGDVVFLQSTSSARSVVLRDIATSGVASNGFRTPGKAPITLGSLNDVVSCVYNGSHWCVVSQSANR